MDNERPGAAYGIDHYVVPVSDVDRWSTFYTNVLGAVPRSMGGERPERPAQARPGVLFTFVGACHMGGAPQAGPLPPSRGLGVSLPQYRYFIRTEEIDEHLRRLDRYRVAHLDPIRTSEEGEEGIAIRFQDPDENQLEFWGPVRMPAGGMDQETAVKVGRVAGAVFESRDLSKTGDFFTRYCGIDPILNADVEKDRLALKFAAGGRLSFKKVNRLLERTGGHIHPLHTAMILRGDEMMRSYGQMWAELPEWDHDPAECPFVPADEAQRLPPRVGIHGSPIGAPWRAGFGRGDTFWDADTNTFHWVPGVPVAGSPTALEPESSRKYLDAHLASKQQR
jgi:catechol 2,3-dioxygenase-like lactoylglutathione lyase family enzyme